MEIPHVHSHALPSLRRRDSLPGLARMKAHCRWRAFAACTSGMPGRYFPRKTADAHATRRNQSYHGSGSAGPSLSTSHRPYIVVVVLIVVVHVAVVEVHVPRVVRIVRVRGRRPIVVRFHAGNAHKIRPLFPAFLLYEPAGTTGRRSPQTGYEGLHRHARFVSSNWFQKKIEIF